MQRTDQLCQSIATGDASGKHSGKGLEKLTSHRCVDVEQIGLGVQDLGSLLNDV